MQTATKYWGALTGAAKNPELAAREIERRYFRPVRQYLKECGLPEDLCVKALERLRSPVFLGKLDSDPGGIRAKVFGAVDEFVREARAEGGYWSSIQESETGDFDRIWVLHLFRRAGEQLGDLDPELGRFFLLYYEGGLEPPAIATRMNCPVDEVRSRLLMARGRIRELVRKSIEDYVGSETEYRAEVAALRMTL